jgi:serine/threonine protein kinase
MPGLEGITLDHYHIQRRLGQGGMADVYLAHDNTTDQDVAIKVLTGSEGTYLERFRREAEAIDKLQHEHILPAFDYGDEEPWHYLVMPYMAYGTLREVLQEGLLPLPVIADLFDQIASALQFAHEHGIIHRDIKPSNILLRDDAYIYLADFGLAKTIEGINELTQTGVLLGTPEYMAPDLANGPATTSSDIYALGILLYEMVAGRVPFSGDTPIAIYWKQIREQPLPPSKMNPNLSYAIDKVLLRALDKDPTRRYQSAQELAYAFRAALSAPSILPDTGAVWPYRNERSTSPIGKIPPLPLRPLALEVPEPISRPAKREPHTVPPERRRKLNRLATSIMAVGLVLFIVLPMTYMYYIYKTHSGSTTITASASIERPARQQSKPTQQATPHDATSEAMTVQNAILHSAPVLVDNLTGNTLNRWTVDGSHCVFGNGGYVVNAMQVNYLQACPMLSPMVGNTAVEVDVTMLGGTSAGMLFRFNGDQYYDFEITTSNQFFFTRHDASSLSGSSSSYLIKNTYSNTILAMGQKNTLLIIADGADFKLYINGNFVGEVQDSTYGNGQIALVSGTSGLVTAGQALFSDLKLFKVG